MNVKIVFSGGALLGFFISYIIFSLTLDKPVTPQVRHPPDNPSGSMVYLQNIFHQLSQLQSKISFVVDNQIKSSHNDGENDVIINKRKDKTTKCLLGIKTKQNIGKFNPTELLETIQTERKATLKKACKRLQFNNICPSWKKSINQHLFYSKNYKLISCDVQKCGYSSWVRAFYHIENKGDLYETLLKNRESVIKTSEDLFRISTNSKKNISQETFDESLKVILVRHPFSRIVSAYNDKMVPTGEGYTYYYGPISRKIYRDYRHLRHNVTEQKLVINGSASFEDFINFITRLKKFDNHWKSFRDLCNPCTSQYDYIAKMETLNNDMEYLKQKLNLTEEHRKNFFPMDKYRSDVNLMKKMFKTIPKQLTRQLYDVYKQDFEMFGYDFPDWLC